MKKPDLHKLGKQQLVKLMELPNRQKETMLAVIAQEETTAIEVSKETGKSRATGRLYLNQLERMGYLKRKYANRKVHFYQQGNWLRSESLKGLYQ